MRKISYLLGNLAAAVLCFCFYWLCTWCVGNVLLNCLGIDLHFTAKMALGVNIAVMYLCILINISTGNDE